MKKVAIYVRSSKDLHNVSCKAQEDELRKLVKDNGDVFYKIFIDEALSSTKDERPAFEEMVSLAKSQNPPFGKIYCLDLARFGRDRNETLYLLCQLRERHGIDVRFSNIPESDKDIMELLEGIMSSLYNYQSRESKKKGVAGQKQNIKQGYRAGGIAPHGYKLVYTELAVLRNGNPVKKSKLAPRRDTAPVVIEYFSRRAKYESRMSIIEDFYKRGIPTPSGKARWSESTVLAWEDNIDTYLGHTVFNRTNEKLKVKGRSKGFLHGKKWKPKEEWEITENTHPPLITYETAEKIRGSRKKRIRATPRHAQQVYTLSGGIMVCSECGTNYAGDRGYYSCNSKGKTGPRCSNGSIKRERIESILFSLIEKKILNFRDVKEVIGRIKERFNGKEVKIPGLNNKIDQIKGKVRKTISLYQQELIEQDELEDMISPLRQQQKTLEQEIKTIKDSNEFQDINDAMIKDVIENLSREVANADPETKKRVIRTLFQSISIHPKENQSRDRMLSIKGICLPLTRDFLVTPRGIEPLLPA